MSLFCIVEVRPGGDVFLYKRYKSARAAKLHMTKYGRVIREQYGTTSYRIMVLVGSGDDERWEQVGKEVKIR